MKYKKNLDPAELWLAEQWLGNSYKLININEITNSIKIRIFKYIENALIKNRQLSPPVNPEALFKERNVLKLTKNPYLPERREGFLQPTKGGFVLSILPKLSKFRRRFTIAHELGHTFFYDLEASSPNLGFSKNSSRYWVQEGYANEIAAAILLPANMVVSNINDAKYHPTIQLLLDMCNRYEVSVEVLHKRLIRNLGLLDWIVFESKVEGEIITTNSAKISKGFSFRNWHIAKNYIIPSPNIITPSNRKELLTVVFSNIAAAVKDGSSHTRSLYKKEIYEIESQMLKRNRCLSVVRCLSSDESGL